MRRTTGLGILFLILVFAALEYYSFSALRFSIKGLRPTYRNIITGLYILITLAWLSMFLLFPAMREGDMNKSLKNFIISFAMGLLITKVLIAAILLIDDVRRLVYWVSSLFYKNESVPNSVSNGMSRSEFFNTIALLLGGTVFATLIYGMTNKYNYTVKSLKLAFDHLPLPFKGMKVIHISDIHSGSLNDPQAILKGIEKINALQPDLIFFTGDLVNNKSDEMIPFMNVFNQLQAKHGVYSTLGNHDYGDYVSWNSPEEKIENLEELKRIHKKLGWNLLMDEHVSIERDGETIAILGVQNTSFKARFHSYGSLEKAYAGSEKHPFKILLSHDPSHWDGEVNSKYQDIDITLSGHTHGMQFGVDIPWLKWSPVKYVYKQWAGLYSTDKQHLYVNRGFGFLGYPGRVGIMPEITVIELV